MAHSRNRLLSALVLEPLETIRHARKLERERGALLYRAIALRDQGDSLVLTRPRNWPARSRRVYARVVRLLGRPPFEMPVPDGDPALAAHLMLHEARQPARRAGVATAMLAGVAAVPALLVLLALCAIPGVRARLVPPDLAEHAAWTASSAYAKFRTSGKGPSTTEGLFFHTRKEEHPWIRIDLPREALLRSVRIENRSDCCSERALPLDVQVPDGDGWRLVCQRRSPFVTWTCHLPPTRTRTFRVMLAKKEFLHLRSIAAFE